LANVSDAVPLHPIPTTLGAIQTDYSAYSQSLPGSVSSLGQPGSVNSLGQVEEGEEDDVVILLGNEEAMEFTNLVADENTWTLSTSTWRRFLIGSCQSQKGSRL